MQDTTPRLRRGPRGGREQVEERVVLAAQKLFAERGFESVTVREIGEAAGVSHALVHRYFGSKRDLLVAVFKANAPPMVAAAKSSQDAHDAGVAMARALLEGRRDYVKLVTRLALDGMSLESLGHSFPAFRRLIEAFERETEHEAVEAGRLPEPVVLACAATALTFGWVALGDWFAELAGWSEPDRRAAEKSLELAIGAMIECSLEPRRSPR